MKKVWKRRGKNKCIYKCAQKSERNTKRSITDQPEPRASTDHTPPRDPEPGEIRAQDRRTPSTSVFVQPPALCRRGCDKWRRAGGCGGRGVIQLTLVPPRGSRNRRGRRRSEWEVGRCGDRMVGGGGRCEWGPGGGNIIVNGAASRKKGLNYSSQLILQGVLRPCCGERALGLEVFAASVASPARLLPTSTELADRLCLEMGTLKMSSQGR